MPGTNNLTLKEWWRVGCDGNNLADAVSGGIYTANSGGGGGSKSIQATWKRHSCGYSIRCSKSRKWEVMITTFKLSLPFILPGKEGHYAHSLANANTVGYVIFLNKP